VTDSAGVQPEENAQSESGGTVIIAFAMNLAIAVAKTVAGLLSGSSAMLSEAAHSYADTITEVLLFVALRRGDKPPDENHPFGYGKATYFWALLAALFTFVAGAGYSILHGVDTIRHGEELTDFTMSYVVLAVAFVLEAVSFARALRQVRASSRRWRVSMRRYLQLTPDTTVKAVALEDMAALIGIAIAALGLALAQVTGSAKWDGLASVAIGLLLLIVAVTLARHNASLLVGEAVPPRLQQAIHDELAGVPEVERVLTLLTMYLGPSSLLVAAKVDFQDDVTSDAVESAADEAERRLRERFPSIRFVFLDPTNARAPR
jgi:cation diffusion facilitator family transporter